MSVFKLDLLFNKERVEKDGIYSLESLYEFVDNEALEYGLRIEKTADGGRTYHDAGRGGEYGSFWAIISILMDADWFKRAVEKLIWYNGAYGGEYAVEDVLKEYEEMGSFTRQPA